MKFQFYYEKLINSKEYKKFLKDFPEAYPCSGFFVLDKEDSNKNLAHIDFFIPSKEPKMYSFKLSGSIEFLNVENFDKKIPEGIGLNYDFDLNKYDKMIQKEMEKQKIKGNVQRLLFSLQRQEGIDYLITTVFISNLGMLKVNININEDKIVSFEKKSFLDMFKILKKGG